MSIRILSGHNPKRSYDKVSNTQTSMHHNAETDGHPDSERRTLMSAVDAIDGRDHLVIADVSRDDAWIAVPESRADSVPASR